MRLHAGVFLVHIITSYNSTSKACLNRYALDGWPWKFWQLEVMRGLNKFQPSDIRCDGILMKIDPMLFLNMANDVRCKETNRTCRAYGNSVFKVEDNSI